MIDKQIFIMAQGKGSRWTYDDRTGYLPPATHKQLVMIGDEPIIVRTLRQLHKREIDRDIIVVADGDYFYDHIKNYSGLLSFREPVGTLINGIWSTKDLWRDNTRMIFLLGDVVFSNNAIDTILSESYNHATFMFGRHGMNIATGKEAKEIFAFSIPPDPYTKDFWIKEMFHFWKEDFGTKLWDFYNHAEMEFTVIDDYTDDVDSPEEYQQFFSILERLAIEDDERLHENRTLSE